MNVCLPSSISIRGLRMTYAYFIFFDSIENYIGLINNNVRFDVVVWYKLSVINYRALVEGSGNQTKNNNAIQVDNGEINDHITKLWPTSWFF